MRLSELEPQFVRYETRIEEQDFVQGDPATWRERGSPTEKRTVPVQHEIHVNNLVEAQGIWFLCPECLVKNNGPVGTHMCDVTFEGRGATPDQGSHDPDGKPVRWNVSGTGFGDLTLTPSIQVYCRPDGGWHGYITGGAVQ